MYVLLYHMYIYIYIISYDVNPLQKVAPTQLRHGKSVPPAPWLNKTIGEIAMKTVATDLITDATWPTIGRRAKCAEQTLW